MNNEATLEGEKIADCGLRIADHLKPKDASECGVETPHSKTLSRSSNIGWGYRMVGLTYRIGDSCG